MRCKDTNYSVEFQKFEKGKVKSEERSELKEQVIDFTCCFILVGVFLELVDQRTATL